jgi:acetoin utilization protein AcuB
MEIRKWMKHPVHTVKRLDSIQHAREVMDKHRVKQVPVTIDGELVGIVTDRDLRDAFPSVFDSPAFGRRAARPVGSDPRKLPVEMVMTPDVTTVTPGDSMVDAARIMRRQHVGSLPVVEAGKLVGIITRSDLIDSFIDLAELEEQRETSPFAYQPPAEAKAAKPAKARARTAAAKGGKPPRPRTPR